MSYLYREPPIDAFYQVSLHLAQRFQSKICLRNRKKKIAYNAMFLNGSKRDERFPQRTFHICSPPCFGPFGQAVSEQKIIRNRPIRNKSCLWWPCLRMNRNKMSNLYSEISKDVSYQVSVHLAKRFQRTIFLEIDQVETRIDYGSQMC